MIFDEAQAVGSPLLSDVEVAKLVSAATRDHSGDFIIPREAQTMPPSDYCITLLKGGEFINALRAYRISHPVGIADAKEVCEFYRDHILPVLEKAFAPAPLWSDPPRDRCGVCDEAIRGYVRMTTKFGNNICATCTHIMTVLESAQTFAVSDSYLIEVLRSQHSNGKNTIRDNFIDETIQKIEAEPLNATGYENITTKELNLPCAADFLKIDWKNLYNEHGVQDV